MANTNAEANMARKPLLESSVLNREGVQSRLAGDDLMSRVIEYDAVKHGRGFPTPGAAEAAAPQAAPELEDSQYVNKLTINSTDNKGDDPQAGSRGARRGMKKGGEAGRAPAALVAGRVQPEVSERFELACALLKKRGTSRTS